MTDLAAAIARANAADNAYKAAIKAAGYKSRWECIGRAKSPAALRALKAAYHAKVAADRVMHEAFKAQRDA